MTSIKGAHAVVTGGSSGIGLAVAHELSRRGAIVSLLARNRDRLDRAAASISGQAHTASVDVTDQRAVAEAIDTFAGTAGPVDILVTSAGQARPGRFLELDDDIFRTMMEVDYFGTLHAVRAVAPAMVARGSGSIVAISSAAALLGIYGYTAYSPAKFAVRGLCEALRDEMRPHGVHVACVFPPDVDTPQLADENVYKPVETAAISGTMTPMQPEQVTAKIVRAIEREQFAVYPNRGTALLARLGPLGAPVLRRLIDRKVRGA